MKTTSYFSSIVCHKAHRLPAWGLKLATGVLGFWLMTPGVRGEVTLTTLFSFNGTNGAVPEATLVQGTDGFLYGTAISGGTNGVSYGGDGTIFRISTNGTFETLIFLDRNFAANPQAGLVQGSDGDFYGTTGFGGPRDSGAVFRVTPAGSFAVLTNFVWPEGEYPNGLVEGADGCFYGTMNWGGTNDGPAGACGTVFKITTNGAITTLLSFNGTNGANPQSGLLRADDGNFYGTTVNGGTNGGWGTVFKMTPDGALTTLASFNGTNGAAPMSPPIRTADGSLYGTTFAGGIYFNGTPYTGIGTVYKIAPDGGFTTLVWFNNTNGANSSFSGLLQARDGNLYGTTERGGAYQRGTIFSLTTNGVLTTLVSFGPNDGREPSAGLVQTGDGVFYGVTMNGGDYDLGTIFRLTINPDRPVLGIAALSVNTIKLTWDAVAGNVYQLQSNPELSSTNWVNAGLSITGVNATITVSDTVGPGPQRFYRVVVLP